MTAADADHQPAARCTLRYAVIEQPRRGMPWCHGCKVVFRATHPDANWTGCAIAQSNHRGIWAFALANVDRDTSHDMLLPFTLPGKWGIGIYPHRGVLFANPDHDISHESLLESWQDADAPRHIFDSSKSALTKPLPTSIVNDNNGDDDDADIDNEDADADGDDDVDDKDIAMPLCA